MDEEYDVIILGTGLKECILSGLLSVNKYKVLHLDRNDYYGAESASLNLRQLYKKFEGSDQKMDESVLGKSKNYAIDLCPKFIMGCGNLVKMLLHTKVTRYLEFRCVDGSYIYKDGKIHEVPMTLQAAVNTKLMNIFQKRRYKNFLSWILKIDFKNKKTWDKCDLHTWTMKQVYEYWRLDENTIALTGHAVALYQTDKYLTDKSKTIECISRLKLYAKSLARFTKSPYIYPIWGLGGLPEGFSRLAAVHGGVYMLRSTVEAINYDASGKVESVKVKNAQESGTPKCKFLIGDPSYFKGTKKVRESVRIAKWICILRHPIQGTSNAPSVQLIFPAKQTGHKSDIYVCVLSNAFQVAPDKTWVAIISAYVYTKNPKKELFSAYKMLGKVVKEFFFVVDTYEACNQNVPDNVYIPSSMDATTHFEQATVEVMKLYKEITGKDVDLTKNPENLGRDPDEMDNNDDVEEIPNQDEQKTNAD